MNVRTLNWANTTDLVKSSKMVKYNHRTHKAALKTLQWLWLFWLACGYVYFLNWKLLPELLSYSGEKRLEEAKRFKDSFTVVDKIWSYSVRNLLYFNGVAFVAISLFSWLVTLIFCRRNKEILKQAIFSSRSIFHHLDIDDVEYQKLMLLYDEKHRHLPESVREFKTNKIETYFSMAHLDEVKNCPNFQSTSLYDARVSCLKYINLSVFWGWQGEVHPEEERQDRVLFEWRGSWRNWEWRKKTEAAARQAEAKESNYGYLLWMLHSGKGVFEQQTWF